jgi:hypothetical protein
MVVGFLWYGPLFSQAWMKEMGMDPNSQATKDKMKQGANASYLMMFIGALLTAWVLAVTLRQFGSDSVGMALECAFWIWLGFYLPVIAGAKLWEGKSWKLVTINAGYQLANLAVMAIILQSWQ